jgi:hypothetical protein
MLDTPKDLKSATELTFQELEILKKMSETSFQRLKDSLNDIFQSIKRVQYINIQNIKREEMTK